MKEFGSDFHTLNWGKGDSLLSKIEYNCNLYALGRHAIEAILRQENIKRLWLPSYFCHDSIARCKIMAEEVKYYSITPVQNPYEVIESLPIEEDDAIFLMNYYGLWSHLHTPDLPCRIIEDHSHDLTSDWALTSRADWCVASLRKTMPVAEGGILWSPVGHKLPDKPLNSQVHLLNAVQRNSAMELKCDYLAGAKIDKDSFLRIYRNTEEQFDTLPISPISEVSKTAIENIDINTWYASKKANWATLSNLIDQSKVKVVSPFANQNIPFSLILQFNDNKSRNKVRKQLVSFSVYPAILWSIPDELDSDAKYFGDRMLSIHCDGRYTADDMYQLATIINHCLV